MLHLRYGDEASRRFKIITTEELMSDKNRSPVNLVLHVSLSTRFDVFLT